MSLSPSPFINHIAQEVADYMIQRGWWVDCTAEKILDHVDDYKELQWWRRLAWEYNGREGKLVELPINPKPGQVAVVTIGEYHHRYLFGNGEWSYVDSRPKHVPF